MATYDQVILCAPCQDHYGDTGPCDQGKPVNSPHRKGVPLPMPGYYKLYKGSAVCAACGQWPHFIDCAARAK